MPGILAYGAYLPRLRLQRSVIGQAHSWFNSSLRGLAKGERSMAAWDEDVITMATEAARECLGSGPRSVDAVLLASTTAPHADRQNATIVKEALNLPDQISTIDLGGSQRAATGALIQSLRMVRAGVPPVLCLAAEKPRARPGSEAEMLGADAAAGLLLGDGDGIARYVGSHSLSMDFVDHFRSADAKFDYGWESRWVREEGYTAIAGQALQEALAKLNLVGNDVSHLVVPIPTKGVADGLARVAGIPAAAVRDNLVGIVGHAGVAQPLVLLAHTLQIAKPGEKIVLLGFGQGCDVLVFEATDAIALYAHPAGVQGAIARGRPETNYMKFLFFSGLLDIERGMRAELDQKQSLTALYRHRKTVLGLVGGRSSQTGAVQFPKSDIPVASTDGRPGKLEDYPLADVPARILTYTADNLTYTPDPPNYYGMVEFDGGGRMMCEFADPEPGSVEVGVPVRMVLRVKAVDEARKFTKYFWKATPINRSHA